MAFALGFRNAEPTEHGIARMIGDDQEGRPAVLVVHRDRRRLVADYESALNSLLAGLGIVDNPALAVVAYADRPP